MELLEREEFLALLHKKSKSISDGRGHCIFISGEAGIGKTSLVKAFCEENKDDCLIYLGACDALFTPRPLAPLYDIMWQVSSDLWSKNHSIDDRSVLFAAFFRELSTRKEKFIIIFEDIHWADEATLDFIKFFARRMAQLKCLFILTYREDDIHSRHPLKNVLSQIPPDFFSRLHLTPLSREAVEKMATERMYNGEDVYSITGGNPFYVNEILACYSCGVPDNIKDSILSVYNRQDEKTRQVWDILSILPLGLNIKYLEKTEPSYYTAVQQSLETKILILKENVVFFKHELYRRTIETSLSPMKRLCLNKKMLETFMESYETDQEFEQIVHHAKNANEYELVVRYAPLAAVRAACVGAHTEAARLYYTAIEYYQGNDKKTVLEFYEAYAYECYLTNQIKEAIIYAGKTLQILREQDNTEKIGRMLRFLSGLWWFEGNRKKAERFAREAVEAVQSQPSSPVKAMVYSNMSHLKMLSGEAVDAINWAEKAIAIANESDDKEALAHALANLGSTVMLNHSPSNKGIKLLQQSLDIAINNSYHEQVARAYAYMGGNAVILKDYVFAKEMLDTGIIYCEERDLDFLKYYMQSWKARLNLETGEWTEAYSIADNLLKIENLPAVTKIGSLAVMATIKMRRGDPDVLILLMEAKAMAFESMELQRIIPSLVALLEYEWLTGKMFISKEDLHRTAEMLANSTTDLENSEMTFWLLKAKRKHLSYEEHHAGYDVRSIATAQKSAAFWGRSGCPYLQALSLFEATDDDKRKAISIVHELGAFAAYERMKMEMRFSGIKSIPRGMRKLTRTNPAFLTGRQLDVLQLLKEGLQNKEIASRLFISAKTVDHHISSIFFKLDVNSRTKAVKEAVRKQII